MTEDIKNYENELMITVFKLMCLKDDLLTQVSDAERESNYKKAGWLFHVLGEINEVIAAADAQVSENLQRLIDDALDRRVAAFSEKLQQLIDFEVAASAQLDKLECRSITKRRRSL